MAVRFTDDQVMRATGATRRRVGDRATYTAVCTDSRHLEPHSIFIALKGERFDGHDFFPLVGKAGAAAVIARRGQEYDSPGDGITVFEVDDTLAALGSLARAHPPQVQDSHRRRHRQQRQDDDERARRGDPSDARARLEDRGQPQTTRSACR